MKKIAVLLSVVGMLFAISPLKVSAALKQAMVKNGTMYGTLKVMESDGWEDKSDGGKYITQVLSVTKTINGYVYIKVGEVSNVKITSAVPGSGFTIVHQNRVTDGVEYLLKTEKTVSSETEVLTVLADIVDPTKKECNLSLIPLSVNCIHVGELYLDKSGKPITAQEYAEICEGVTTTPTPTPVEPDVPDSPQTGSAIPYVAVGGGLLAIAGVYFFSRKSNKMYKI